MDKTKTNPLPTKEGWAVHVYDSDRHLRFTLEPSHLWAFSWGIGVGILVAILWSALHSMSHSASYGASYGVSNTTDQSPLVPNSETTCREGFSAEPARSFPFGID